jgi:metallo-beta-lactamase family protein
MLPDSGYIQELEVSRRNTRRARQGKPLLELIYSREDGQNVIEQITIKDYQKWFDLCGGAKARFWNAGHILGSASIEIEIPLDGNTRDPLRLLFSGDLGPEHKSFHPEPTAPSGFDYILCESTYGDRPRVDINAADRRRQLGEIATQTFEKNGALLVPAFAVERTQELLADFVSLMLDGTIGKVPFFLDSPLARNATNVFLKHAEDLEGLDEVSRLFEFPNFHVTESVSESKAIDAVNGPMIVISASGMCDAGRIRHRLKNFLWRDTTTVLLVGYQAQGTMGRRLAEGSKTVRIHREDIDVRARIRHVDWYSGHADSTSLTEWITDRCPVRRALFLVHGEPGSAEALRAQLEAQNFTAKIEIPKLDYGYDLLASTLVGKPIKSARKLTSTQLTQPDDWRSLLAEFSIDLRKTLEDEKNPIRREDILVKLKETLGEPGGRAHGKPRPTNTNR